jgi:hypothetical protein
MQPYKSSWPESINYFLSEHIKACAEHTKEDRALVYLRLDKANVVKELNVLTKKAQGEFQRCLKSHAIGQNFNLDTNTQRGAQVWVHIQQCNPPSYRDKDGNLRLKPECAPPFWP